MSWTLKTPPAWAPNAVATEKGWEIPLAGTDPADELKELIVAIRSMPLKAGAATISSVAFGAASYAPTDELSVTVTFTEAVNVTAGAMIEVASTGATNPVELYALAQSGTNQIVFDQVSTLDAPVLVDDETMTLSIAAQTISGTIVDEDSAAAAAVLTVSAPIAAAAGTREIVEIP